MSHVKRLFVSYSAGAKYTEADLQQALASARRDHLETSRKEQDEALFKLRGEQAVLSEHYVETIQKLEEEVRLLKRGSQRSLSSLKSEEGSDDKRRRRQGEDGNTDSPSKLEARSVCRAVEGR